MSNKKQNSAKNYLATTINQNTVIVIKSVVNSSVEAFAAMRPSTKVKCRYRIVAKVKDRPARRIVAK